MRRPFLESFEAYPLVVAARVDRAISAERQIKLLSLFDDVISSSAKMHDRTQIRSSSSAYHFGVWEKNANTPFLTRDTHHQGLESQRAIHNLMRFVARQIAPIYKRHMDQLAPEQMACQSK